MRSHELLEFFGVRFADDPETRIRTVHVDFPPEDGAVAAAVRHGERTELRQMVAQVANEVAVIRAAYVPNADASEYDSQFFLTEAKCRERRSEHGRAARPGQESDGDSMAAMWHQKEVS